MINQIFAYSYAWGMGGALDDFGKERMDDVVKECFKAINIPPTAMSYDYYFDSKKDNCWKSWSSKVP